MGKWYISIQTEFEKGRTDSRRLASVTRGKTAPIGSEIGIDLGIIRFATLSNGQYFPPVNAFKNLRGKLAKLQKRLKNKIKFSNNWKKLQAKIARLHHRIANIRKNHLHQISNIISKNHAIVYMEELQVKNMSQSAKGTVSQPGRNVKQKSGLNRAILDQGWYEFRRQLEYKLAWRGGHLVLVPPHNTSRCCPQCNHTAKGNRRTQSKFHCLQCGYQNNADVVGAMNVLKLGQGMSSKSVK